MGKFIFTKELAAKRLEQRLREQTFEDLNTSGSGENNPRNRGEVRMRNIRGTDSLSYPDEEVKEEYSDIHQPKNLGRRKPLTSEWDDYIEEEQAIYLEGLTRGENVKPAWRTRKSKSMREFEERNTHLSPQFSGMFNKFMKVD